MIDRDGQVTTLAGGDMPGFVDGTGSQARFDTPTGVAVDATGVVWAVSYTHLDVYKRQDQAYANGTFNTTNDSRWSDPYGETVAGGRSLTLLHETSSRTYTITFSKAVDNPVLHVDRLGGALGNDPNSSRWTLSNSTSQGGAVTLTRLSGNAQFLVTGSTFVRATGTAFSGTANACLLYTSRCV